MSIPIQSPLLLQDSFGDSEHPQEVQREQVDIGQFTEVAREAFVSTGTTTVTNSVPNRQTDADGGTGDLPTGNRLPRNRIRYANQCLLATSDLFLADEGAETVLFMLQSTIVECPNKNKPGNLGRFRIDWLRALPPDFDWFLLREWFPSTAPIRKK